MRTIVIALLVLAVTLLGPASAWADEPLAPGATLPDFIETTVGGKPCDSASLRGHGVLVWFTNFSQGAYEALPTLVTACGRRPAVRLVIVSLDGAFDSRAKHFADQFSLHEQTALDADGSTVRRFSGTFMEGVVPLYNLFLFDSNGKMTARFHCPGVVPAELERQIQRL